MPRDGSGVYSAPAGTTASPNTTIESSKYNALVSDLVTDANAARPLSAGGTGASSASAARTALGAAGLTDENTFTKTQIWAKGADVASAAALTLGDDGNYFDITGTTSITSIATVGAGAVVKLHFDGVLTLTHHSTDLVLPGGANITTAAGDEAELVEYATGDWRMTNYQRAAVGPAQAWELISTSVGSGVASATFTGLSAYRRIRVTGTIYPSTDNVAILLQTSTNNGSSYDGGAGDYTWQYTRGVASSSSSGGDTNATAISIGGTSAVGSASGEALQVDFTLDDFNQSRQMRYLGSAYAIAEDGTQVTSTTGGRRTAPTARDAFRIIAATGNITQSLLVEGSRT